MGNANLIVELLVGAGGRAASHAPIAPLDTNLGLAQEEAFSAQADIFQDQEYLRVVIQEFQTKVIDAAKKLQLELSDSAAQPDLLELVNAEDFEPEPIIHPED